MPSKTYGKLKMVLFHMKKYSIQIRSQHSPKLCYKPEMDGNKPLFWQNYIIFFCHFGMLLHLCTESVVKNFKFAFLTQIAYKETCCKPVSYKNKPFSTKIKLFYVKTKLFTSNLCNFAI